MARQAPPQVEFVYVVRGGDFAGNRPPYDSWAQAGIRGYLWDQRDPEFVGGMVETKERGQVAGEWIVPAAGETGISFGRRAAQAAREHAPAIIVLQVEEFGKGSPGSQGWNWSADAAAAFNAGAPDVAAAVNVLPLQDDFNYGAWTNVGARIWPECYDEAMRYFNAATVARRVVANSVPRDMVRPVVPSNSYAAWVADLRADSRFLYAVFRADQLDDAALRVIAPLAAARRPRRR